ncbi:MAG: LAGLIDADG endonuclease [Candidatus Paceibacterota bacterium]
MDNIVGRLHSLFPSHQFDVIIGSLLGDARLECRSMGKRSLITARFRVHHGHKQKNYVFWKYQILKNLVLKEPREISWDNPKRNLHEVSWYFHTKSLKEFGILHSYFYKNGVKILPETIFELLTPQMIAVWFMDDGSNNGGSLTLNTHGFSKKEQERIVKYFEAKYAIKAKIVKDRNKWKIAIGSYDYNKFISIIKNFVAPSMIYKIVSPRNDFALYAQERSF